MPCSSRWIYFRRFCVSGVHSRSHKWVYNLNMSDMEFMQTIADPDRQVEYIKELWQREAALFHKHANHSNKQKQPLEHSDALLDAYLQIRKLGKTAVESEVDF